MHLILLLNWLLSSKASLSHIYSSASIFTWTPHGYHMHTVKISHAYFMLLLKLLVSSLGLKNNCLVVLQNFFFLLRRSGRADFFFFSWYFFSNQSRSYMELYPLYLPIKVKTNLLYQKYLNTSLKPVSKCKQVENNNLKNIFKRSKFSKKKKTFLGILKIRGSTLLYSEHFFPVFKN